jgi:hypothetical protein
VRLLESPLAHNQVLRGAAVDQAQVRPSRHHCIAWASASRAWLTLDDGESAMDRRLLGPVVLVRDGAVPDRLERRQAQLEHIRVTARAC